MSAFGNNEEVEQAWAEQAFFFIQRYSKQMAHAPNPKAVRFCPQDDEIYLRFRERFPELDVTNFQPDNIENESWRTFLEELKLMSVPDYNLGRFFYPIRFKPFPISFSYFWCIG